MKKSYDMEAALESVCQATAIERDLCRSLQLAYIGIYALVVGASGSDDLETARWRRFVSAGRSRYGHLLPKRDGKYALEKAHVVAMLGLVDGSGPETAEKFWKAHLAYELSLGITTWSGAALRNSRSVR